MNSTKSSQANNVSCVNCKHRQTTATCAAFPGGIPLMVLDGQIAHTKVLAGQVGKTVFEAAPNKQ